jgi:hypothetical protein
MKNFKARNPHKIKYSVYHFGVNLRIPYNTLFADLLFSGFKLGFYQAHHLCSVF